MGRPARGNTPGAPRQRRSRETLERILEAVEELLEEELFEQLTMASVAERAGVAVGTLYTRFGTKEDLLPALFGRHDAQVAGRLSRSMERVAALPSLLARIEGVVEFAVDYHRRYRGLLRALTMYVRAHPEGVPAELWGERAQQYRAVAQLVVGDGGEVRRSDPLAAAEFALGLVNSVCREQVLFGDVTPLRQRRTSLAALKRHLSATIHRDLAGRID